MKSIVFIANNKDLDYSIFVNNQDIIKNSDILHFNKALFKIPLFNSNRNFIFLSQKEDLSWFGLGSLDYDYFDRIYLGSKDIKNNKLNYNDNLNKMKFLDVNPFFDYKNETGKLLPSAGFFCFHYFKEKYDVIYLAGFTFQGWKFHNWQYEKQYLLNHPKIKLLC